MRVCQDGPILASFVMLAIALCCAGLAAEETESADTTAAAVEVAPREGLYIDEGERLGMRDRVSRMLELLMQEQVGEAAALCNSIRQEAGPEFLRVPVVVQAAAGTDLAKSLPPGLIRTQAGESGVGSALPGAENTARRGLSSKAQREMRETPVIRYVGVRWFCDRLLAGHAGLRASLDRLVGIRAGEAKKKAIESGTDEGLYEYAKQYGCAGPGDEAVLLFARRCMERGELCRALALFELCRGGPETDKFIDACRALRAASAGSCGLAEGVPGDKDADGSRPGAPAGLPEGPTIGASRLSPALAVEMDLVSVAVAAEPGTQKFTHYLACSPMSRRSGGAGQHVDHGWLVPVCWQTAPGTGLAGGGGAAGEDETALETLGGLLTMPAVTDDGLVVAATGHGAVVAVDLFFGRPVWLVCYAVDVTEGGERKELARSPFISQFAPPYGWSPQPPAISCNVSADKPGARPNSGEAATARARRVSTAADSFAVVTPLDASCAYLLRAADGCCLGAIESASMRRRGAQGVGRGTADEGTGSDSRMRGRRFEFRWSTADDSGFVFLVGSSVVALDFRRPETGGGEREGQTGGGTDAEGGEPAADRAVARGGAADRMPGNPAAMPALDNFPLPEAVLSGGIAAGGVLVVPTARGLYEIDFARSRPAMSCLAEWRLPDGSVVRVRVAPDGALQVLYPGDAVIYGWEGWIRRLR
ncbi:MAG: hypothetical protein RDV41_02360 [Planctomycetota bacterium]|nr:hypothetical protein [Planctomycetota bacterium]